jgi:hypothetical protein
LFVTLPPRINNDSEAMRPLPRIVKTTATTIAILILLEGLLALCSHFPAATIGHINSHLLRGTYKFIFNSHVRDTATVLWATYDDQLTYVLPAHLHERLQNIEYDTHVETNQLGLRDDEASLVKPAVIVLGDSYTFGLGVDQQQTYSQVLESLLGRKVLNAGIESYGTAREITSLARLDQSNMQTLVIQYCPNDLFENTTYVENGMVQKPSIDKVPFEAAMANYNAHKRYYPGKYTWLMLKYAKFLYHHKLPSNDEISATTTKHIQYFETILRHMNIAPNTQVIAFAATCDSWCASSHGPEDALFDQATFIQTLKQHFAADSRPFSHSPRFIDLSDVLMPSDFYILDSHWNAGGHRKVAERIAEEITREKD